MDFDEIVKVVSELPLKDKLRLNQLLMHLAKNEEEAQASNGQLDDDILDKLDYVLERIKKSKPTKVDALSNFIKAMFNFKGGISDGGIAGIIDILCKKKYIAIEGKKVTYLK